MSIDPNAVSQISARRWPTHKKRYKPEDIEFMNSLSSAVLARSPKRTNFLLMVITLLLASLLAWANFTELDERTRGMGRMIPSQQLQVVQNLEGGIVKEIKVLEGEQVKKGQILVVIDNTGAGSSFAESQTVIDALRAQSIRLSAEAGIDTFENLANQEPNLASQLIAKEKRLYDSNLQHKKSEIDVVDQKEKQRKIDLSETWDTIKTLKTSQEMMAREIELTEPMVKKRLVSELEFIQLQQKVLDKKHEYDIALKKAESLKAQIKEAQNQKVEIENRYKLEAQKELNKVLAELDRMKQNIVAIEDRDILEIVPAEDRLLVEAEIKPQDIAFLYPGLKAVVKVTAYDFAIYGGLDGKLVHISADTITNERDEEFYVVRILTDQNYLGSEDNKKEIIAGMTAQVDIITGKKTIMQYLLKPILRAKNNALRER
jgi:adhesin transport system membrane fusion protein